MNQYATSADLNYIPTPEQDSSGFVLLPNDCYPFRVVEANPVDARTGKPMIEWKLRIPAPCTGGVGEQILTHRTMTPMPGDGNYFSYFQMARAIGLDPVKLRIIDVITQAPGKPGGAILKQTTAIWRDKDGNEQSGLRSEIERAVPWGQVPIAMITKLQAARANGAAPAAAVPQAPSPVQAAAPTPTPEPVPATAEPVAAPPAASYDF